MTTINAPETILTPVSVRLVSGGCVGECNLHNWKPYSDKLDWSVVKDSKDWYVEVMYDNGKGYPVAAVRIDGDDHTVINISSEGAVEMRAVTVKQIIPTVRLFLSVLVNQDNLKIGVEQYEQLGELVTKKPPMMFIRRRIDGDD